MGKRGGKASLRGRARLLPSREPTQSGAGPYSGCFRLDGSLARLALPWASPS